MTRKCHNIQTDTWHQETGTLEHRQISNTYQSQNKLSKAFSSLYLRESVAKLEMTQYKRLTRRKYHNHKLQTNPWHHEEEPHNNHETL